jgi:uncharacterized membrane protein
MATVAGVTFSITVVALSLAANQYSPRTLRNYMRDRGNQWVLGSFLGVFAYSLLVLRMVGSKPALFVPSLAVLAGIVLAVTSLALFIYFVHHVSASLTATHIVSNVSKETIASLRNLFRVDQNEPPAASDEPPAAGRQRVPAFETGYLQSLDISALVSFAAAHNCVVHTLRDIGGFVIETEPLFEISGQPPDDAAIRRLNRAANIVRFRSIHQDPAFGIRQIVDVALKALSPGINDTTTAITCIDYLAPVLLVFAGCPDPVCRHFDHHGTVRAVTRGITFAALAGQAFDPIIPNAANNAEVLGHILHTVDRLFERVSQPDRAASLIGIIQSVREAAEREIRLPAGRFHIVEQATHALARWDRPAEVRT